MKRLRRNRIMERAGVNAARAFFEENGCTFVEVDLASDYGKDAYVDLGDGKNVSPICSALQIKSGLSYKVGNNYVIPGNEEDMSMWKDSTIPIIGLVFDPGDKQIRWVNISEYLCAHEGKITSIPIAASAILQSSRLVEFANSVRRSAKLNKENPLLQLSDDNEDRQRRAIVDCFLFARTDYRYFIGIRNMLHSFPRETRRLALHALGHLTSHPDIFWTDNNWIPSFIKTRVQPFLRWSSYEVISILQVVELEEYSRGSLGLTAFMLLTADPSIEKTLDEVISMLKSSCDDTFHAAVMLRLYLAEEGAESVFLRLVRESPWLMDEPLMQEVKGILDDHGSITIF
ncbi:DUF4365 domain-containing protein [Janthinobacterium sp. RT4P48]|uniref:DUF4365 domain-containing protein n=1 Tax=Janthinobacterium sp. RT4P48 TaxID=3424188 RepID=UPI003F292406